MTSRELVAKTIRGENTTGITPVYGWVFANLEAQLSEKFGSVAAFEDHYKFDMAHIFGGPSPFNMEEMNKIKAAGEELTPDIVLQYAMNPVDNMADYQNIVEGLEHHGKQRDRFCYLQTNGIFECVNGVFGIEDHLCNMLLYTDEMAEIYARLAQWNKQFALNAIELGVDMIHVSDDWGAQRSLLFSKELLRELVYPNHKVTCDAVKQAGAFLSMHSDGCVMDALDVICELGYDVIHPWQETAGMDYQVYLDKYSDKFGILGGLCIQSTLGFGDYAKVESEIKRVFELLKGKRWMFCTTHFVQDHCSIDELCFAYDLAVKLANK